MGERIEAGTRSFVPIRSGRAGSSRLARASERTDVRYLCAIAVSESPERTTYCIADSLRVTLPPPNAVIVCGPAIPSTANPAPPLEAAHCCGRLRPEVAVDHASDPVPGEQELEHGHIPADTAAAQRPLAEERTSEPAEGAPGRLARNAVDREPARALEGADRSCCPLPGDAIDRPEVETIGAQGHLQPGGLGICGRRRRGQREAGRRKGQ